MRAELSTSLERVGRFPPFRPSRFSRSALLAVALVLLLCAPALAFSDTAGHPYVDAIDDLSSREIINGFEDGTFGPNKLVMRQQFAKMIVGTMGLTPTEQDVCFFPDVSVSGATGLYPDNFVALAAAKGITTGYTDGQFRPGDNISRAQVLTMVVRAADNLAPGTLNPTPAGFKATWGSFDPTHAPNAAKAEANGLLAGMPVGSLDPWGKMPRGEVAQVLHNLLDTMGGGDEVVDRIAVSLGAADTAAALADPARAEDGLWSLLANLHIGVYTPQGKQVMPGSETSSSDFYLFTFQLPVLTNAATELGPTTTELHERFVALGVEISEGDFLASLRQAYLEGNDGEFLPELFRAMGLKFEPGEQLTSLQALLIYIDALVPANGLDTFLPAGAVEGSALQALGGQTLTVLGACDALRGDGADAGWGFVWQVGSILSEGIEKARTAAKWGSGGFAALLDPIAALHALMVAIGTELEVTTTRTAIHETHPGEEPQQAVYTASARFNSDLVPEDLISCAPLAGFSVPPPGPVEGMGVEWQLDDPVLQHATWRLEPATVGSVGSTALTNAEGKSVLKIIPNVEAAQGLGALHEELATVTVTMRIQQGDVFNAFAAIQELVFPRRFKGQLKVAWHESTWHLRLDWRLVNESTNMDFIWNVYFLVEEDGRLTGRADGSASGWLKGFGTTYGAFKYVLDPDYARQRLDVSIWEFSFRPEAFVATEWTSTQENGDAVTEEIFAEMMAQNLQGVVAMAPFGRIDLRSKSGLKTSFALEDGSRLYAELQSAVIE
ncbi:MAG: S-layer homology domain-containing protein [Thermoleophilia bacterium]